MKLEKYHDRLSWGVIFQVVLAIQQSNINKSKISEMPKCALFTSRLDTHSVVAYSF